jgi:hypothetical protein
MKIFIKNLGAIRQASFSLADFTVICGANNTGKTYATYALFSFLSFWRDAFPTHLSEEEEEIQRLLKDGSIELNIQDYGVNVQKILDEGCRAFTRQLPDVFASSEKHFSESEFKVELALTEISPNRSFERQMGAAKTQLFSISKKNDSSFVSISLLVEKEKLKIPNKVISRVIGDALKEIFVGHIFPKPFIASAERTGAAIFSV